MVNQGKFYALVLLLLLLFVMTLFVACGEPGKQDDIPSQASGNNSGASVTDFSEGAPGASEFSGGTEGQEENVETGEAVSQEIDSANDETKTPDASDSTEKVTDPSDFTESETAIQSETGSGDREEATESSELPETGQQTETTAGEQADTLSVTYLSSPVHINNHARITVQGKPNTEYTITVYYSTTASKAKGLEKQTSDQYGNASWEWRVGASVKSGDYRIVITGGGETITEYFTVIGTE